LPNARSPIYSTQHMYLKVSGPSHDIYRPLRASHHVSIDHTECTGWLSNDHWHSTRTMHKNGAHASTTYDIVVSSNITSGLQGKGYLPRPSCGTDMYLLTYCDWIIFDLIGRLPNFHCVPVLIRLMISHRVSTCRFGYREDQHRRWRTARCFEIACVRNHRRETTEGNEFRV